MKRRDLLAAFAAGLFWPPPLVPGRSRRARAPWTFRLDGAARWTLASREGRPVVAGAEVAVTVGGGGPAPLEALDRLRQFRLTDADGANAGWQIVGTVQGVEVSAQFLDGPPPTVAVTARGLADEQSLDEIRFFDTRAADLPALGGRPTLWANGYLSSDPCRVIALGPSAALTSHWALAVLPGAAAHPTAFAFGVDDAGEGRFDCAAGHVVASSRFRGRTVGATCAPAGAALTLLPSDDPLGSLVGMAGGRVPARVDVPAGWCVRGAVPGSPTEADVLAALDGDGAFRGGPLVVRIGPGYQRSAGDWETNDAFPHGHRWLTDRIHAAGFRAGLWLAPLLVAERSGIPTAHPDWLLRTPDGDPVVVEETGDRGGRVYALDAAQVSARDYLRDLARHTVAGWGYDELTLDQLRFGAVSAGARGPTSRSEAYRAALRALREGAANAFVTACAAPLQHAVGLVDAVRLAPDGDGFETLRRDACSVALRGAFQGGPWLNDPGRVKIAGSLSLDEARLWATVAAFAGGPTISDDLPARLPAERLEVLKRMLPVAPLEARRYDMAPDASGTSPSWLFGRIDDDWWMLAGLNWGETARRFAFSLASHGAAGPLTAYDVWGDQRLADAEGQVTLGVAPRSALVLSLRRRRRAPAVAGTTRHVVQGFDLEDEHWDDRSRTLSGRSVMLDDRPYGITIALPAGLTPLRAASDPDAGAAVTVAGSAGRRAARLVLAAPPGNTVSWEVKFDQGRSNLSRPRGS